MAGRRTDPTLSLSTAEGRDRFGLVWLVINPDEPNERTFVVKDKAVVVGKDSSCDLCLDDAHVSREHCRLQITEQGLRVEDLSSRNGTLVNGTPVKLTVLTRPATFLLGKTTIRLEIEEPIRGHVEFGDAVGDAPSMQKLFALMKRLAGSDIAVTLLGETGVGKDVLARALHASGARAAGPFSVFDCGAVAPNLIESALFGHVKGAFTGAVADRQGAFESAHRGTLFLDEIAELPLDLQPRMLRVLEERSVRRVGGVDGTPIDVRVVSATNRDLEKEVEQGRFRQDLFFRLTGAVVQIPPLRERLEDFPRLIASAIAETGRDLQIADATMAALRSYDWPGNVRELKNVICSAAAFCDGPALEPRHLLFFKKRTRQPTLDGLPLGGRTLEKLERAAIKQTLEQVGGNKTKAAKALGIASSTLYEKIKKYEL